MLSYIDNKNELVLCKMNYDKDIINDKLMNVSNINERMDIMKYINLSEVYDFTINQFNNDFSIITDLFKDEDINGQITKLKKVFCIKDESLFCYELKSLFPLFARYYLDFYNLVELEEIGRYHMECINSILNINKEVYGSHEFIMNLKYIIYASEIYSEIMDIINKRNNYISNKEKIRK